MKSAVSIFLTLLLLVGLLPGQLSEPLVLSDSATLQGVMIAAFERTAQLPPLEVSVLGWKENPAMELKNQYFQVLSARPDLKYAYDLQIQANGNFLTCEIAYMPFKTGKVTVGAPAGTLHALLQVAQTGLGQEQVALRLTNPALDVDTMNRVLCQVGGGQVLCQLSRDATALVYTPAMGLTMAQSMQALSETDRLAGHWAARLLRPSMTQDEQLRALYTELTDTVRYDRRYYDDWSSMPLSSTTALGALRDNLAICGGYAQALQALCQQAGIGCYTVSGTSRGEYHMWNIICIDGQWRYFDPTADRGCAKFGFSSYGKTGDALTASHTWDAALVQLLIDPLA